MKISIESTKPITENFLLDISENKIDFILDESFPLKEGWYELNLPYTGQRTKIKDIKINETPDSLKFLIIVYPFYLIPHFTTSNILYKTYYFIQR